MPFIQLHTHKNTSMSNVTEKTGFPVLNSLWL